MSFFPEDADGQFLETDPDKQDEFGDPVETIARLSFDVSRGESLVEKDVRQINFDLYAETFRETILCRLLHRVMDRTNQLTVNSMKYYGPHHVTV